MLRVERDASAHQETLDDISTKESPYIEVFHNGTFTKGTTRNAAAARPKERGFHLVTTPQWRGRRLGRRHRHAKQNSARFSPLIPALQNCRAFQNFARRRSSPDVLVRLTWRTGQPRATDEVDGGCASRCRRTERRRTEATRPGSTREADGDGIAGSA